MSVIYAKTEKGLDEVVLRTNRLPQRMRQLLILINGSLSTQDLFGLTNPEDLPGYLNYLEPEGFICRLAEAPAGQKPGAKPVVAAPRNKMASGEAIAEVKAYLIDFLENMLGDDAAEQIADIESCQDQESLMKCVSICVEIVRSMSGERRAGEFQQTIRGRLSEG